jgi:CIC family chloride channel protein
MKRLSYHIPEDTAPEDGRRGQENRRLMTLCILACATGLLTGMTALFLQVVIALATNLFFFGRCSLTFVSPADHPLGLLAVLVPPLGGLVVGLLARYGARAGGDDPMPSGVKTNLVERCRIGPRNAVLRPLAEVISLGSGAPLGAEGPAISAGACLAKLVGSARPLTGKERRVLLAVGAAAGIAVTFNAPLAAVLLAVELALFELRVGSFVPVALASALGAGLRWLVLGSKPIIPFSVDPLAGGWELPAFVFLGLCSGLFVVAISRGLLTVEAAFGRLRLHWLWWPALGGTLVGFVGLMFPQALGTGSEYLATLTTGAATFGFLLAMLLFKTLAWMACLGSGTSGGVLTPLLLIGGALGGLLACAADWVAPAAFTPSLWAPICMASVFAGALRTPLTAVVLAVELTHASNALLPLLIACTVSDLVSRGLLKHSVLTERTGWIVRDDELDALASHTVGQVMSTEVRTVPLSLPLSRLFDSMNRSHGGRYRGYPVVDDLGRLCGMVTRSDLPEPALRDELGWLIVADVMGCRPLIVAWPDEPVRAVAERMRAAGVGQLPVVLPQSTDHIVGIVSRSDVLKALAIPDEDKQDTRAA